LGNTDTGVVFTPILPSFTGITTLVKRVGDPDQELNVVVKNSTGVELSAGSVVLSPMYKDFDMATYNLRVAHIVGEAIDVYATDTLDLIADGSIVVRSNGANVSLVSSGDIELTPGIPGSNANVVKLYNPLDMNGRTIQNVPSIENSAGDIELVAGSTSVISAQNVLDMNGYGIVNCPSILAPNVQYYGEFYLSSTQTNATASQFYRIAMANTRTATGFTLTTTGQVGKITCSYAGKYMVSWNAYLFHGGGSSAQTHINLVQNGSTIVTFSGKNANLSNSYNEVNLSNSLILTLGSGDNLQFQFYTTNVNTSLTAVAPPSSLFAGVPAFSVVIIPV
jgi:hypothetical protein